MHQPRETWLAATFAQFVQQKIIARGNTHVQPKHVLHAPELDSSGAKTRWMQSSRFLHGPGSQLLDKTSNSRQCLGPYNLHMIVILFLCFGIEIKTNSSRLQVSCAWLMEELFIGWSHFVQQPLAFSSSFWLPLWWFAHVIEELRKVLGYWKASHLSMSLLGDTTSIRIMNYEASWCVCSVCPYIFFIVWLEQVRFTMANARMANTIPWAYMILFFHPTPTFKGPLGPIHVLWSPQFGPTLWTFFGAQPCHM